MDKCFIVDQSKYWFEITKDYPVKPNTPVGIDYESWTDIVNGTEVGYV